MSVQHLASQAARSRPGGVRYSICTLVNNHEEYFQMAASFRQQGFAEADCEYLYIDNSARNEADAFTGYNQLLQAAQGTYIILCHQDILLDFDGRAVLEERIAELDKLDPAWGLLGNAGGVAPGIIIYRLTDPDGSHNTGVFPGKVESLDEQFILVKREANLSLSRDLHGFHFYGTDLCQIARILGWNAWVVDFNLYHKSKGSFNESFYEMSRALSQKYQRALSGRVVQTTCMQVRLSNSPFLNWMTVNKKKCLFERIYQTRKNLRKYGKDRHPGQPKPSLRTLGWAWYALFWSVRRVQQPLQNLQRWFAIRHWKNTQASRRTP
jgi:hypothetical protein